MKQPVFNFTSILTSSPHYLVSPTCITICITILFLLLLWFLVKYFFLGNNTTTSRPQGLGSQDAIVTNSIFVRKSEAASSYLLSNDHDDNDDTEEDNGENNEVEKEQMDLKENEMEEENDSSSSRNVNSDDDVVVSAADHADTHDNANEIDSFIDYQEFFFGNGTDNELSDNSMGIDDSDDDSDLNKMPGGELIREEQRFIMSDAAELSDSRHLRHQKQLNLSHVPNWKNEHLREQSDHILHLPPELITDRILPFCDICSTLSLGRSCFEWYMLLGHMKPTLQQYAACFCFHDNDQFIIEYNEHVALYLIQNGYFLPSALNNLALIASCAFNFAQLVRYLLSEEIVDPLFDMHSLFNTALVVSCRYARDQLVDMLLTYKTKYNRTRLNLLFTNTTCHEQFTYSFIHHHENVVNTFLSEVPNEEMEENRDTLITTLIKKADRCSNELEFACKYGFIHLVRFLINNRQYKEKDDEALLVACQYGEPEIVKLLLKDGRFSASEQCLIAAVEQGHTEIWELLLSNASINVGYNNGMVLKKAMSAQNDVFINRILFKEQRVPYSIGENFALFYALSRGNMDLVRELLKQPNVNPMDRNGKFLLLACKRGFDDLVLELLSSHVIDDSLLCRMLHVSCQKKHTNIVKIIIEELEHRKQTIDPLSGKGFNSSLFIACKKGYWDIMALLLNSQYFEEIDEQCLILACQTRAGYHVIPLLLSKMDVTTAVSSTCLLEACRNGCTETVHILIQNERFTPTNLCLIETCKLGHESIVRLLLQCDTIDPSAKDSECLAKAIQGLHKPVVKLLIEDGRVDMGSVKCRDAIEHPRVHRSDMLHFLSTTMQQP